MQTVFFGTSRYSAKFLELIIKNGLKINLVVSAPPKPIGRKQILAENPTTIIANKLKIPKATSPKDLMVKQFKNLTIGIMLDFNQIISQEIINLFSRGIINIHFSKLPKYRGPSPIQQTILNGDKEAWITYFLITEKLDEGPILSQTSLPLSGTETTESLYNIMIEKASQEIKKIINDYLNERIKPYPQSNNPSYTHKLLFKDTKIDWKQSPQKIERLIRAAYPEPGAWTEVIFNNQKPIKKKLKILKSHLENGKLALDEVQLEGKKPVTWKQFKEGYPNALLNTNS